MKKFYLEEEAIEKLLRYLVGRPYHEVGLLLTATDEGRLGLRGLKVEEVSTEETQ